MEWLILDDSVGDEQKKTQKLFDTFADTMPNIFYIHSTQKQVMGHKLNHLCSLARGDIIVVMDDDDFYPPTRVSTAVAAFVAEPKKLIAGCSKVYMYFQDENAVYCAGPYSDGHALNCTMAFRSSYLINHRYDDAEVCAVEDMIEFEILHSTALADTIGEFRETLEQIRIEFGLTQEWVDDLVAHENAHANVARDTGHEWVGYGAVFIKDDNGQLSAVQPVHFTKPDLSWGPMELITKSIEVTEAPAVYGNKLSEGDVANLEQDKARLEKIREQLGLK